jgi:hypothetical protein
LLCKTTTESDLTGIRDALDAISSWDRITHVTLWAKGNSLTDHSWALIVSTSDSRKRIYVSSAPGKAYDLIAPKGHSFSEYTDALVAAANMPLDNATTLAIGRRGALVETTDGVWIVRLLEPWHQLASHLGDTDQRDDSSISFQVEADTIRARQRDVYTNAGSGGGVDDKTVMLGFVHTMQGAFKPDSLRRDPLLWAVKKR